MQHKARLHLLGLILAAASAGASASILIQHPPVMARATDAASLLRARDMARLGNYRGAIGQLDRIATEQVPLDYRESQEFLYLLGTSLYATDDPRCADVLEKYLSGFAASADARQARLSLGDYHFYAHQWADALATYDGVDLSSLDADSRALYTYRKALCLVCLDRPEEARPLFKSIADNKEFALAALYYDAYIDYTRGNDSQALAKFTRVADRMQDSDGAAPAAGMAPRYYIAQILFRQGDWENAANTAHNLLRRQEYPELADDTRRVLGLARYKLGDLTSARGPLEAYVTAAGSEATPDAVYALGACEYAAGDLDAAQDRFSRVAHLDDAVGQGASLYLGQIEAARRNPSAAAIYFEKAYRMGYDPKVAETALYDYVAARSEGGGVPFDSSVEMLRQFITRFPDSEYAPAIERHLAQLCYSAGDYDAALKAIDAIRNPSGADRLMQQKILYAAGTSALSAGEASRAEQLLTRCINVRGGDSSVTTQARIWLGDALYAAGKYADAEKSYAAAASAGNAGSNSALLQYDLGYSRMMLNKFPQAATAFRQALADKGELNSALRRDARMRLADCRYYTGDYDGALTEYASLRSEGADADYASYRHAQIRGLRGDISGKIAELEALIKNFPSSTRMPDILTELADTYATAGDNTKAAEAYSGILDRYPVDAGAPRAALGKASALMAAGRDDDAVEAYEALMMKWPASDEARTADNELRKYFAANHRIDEYASFVRTVPGFSVDAAQLDDLAYSQAENDYLDNPASIRPIQDYITRYPTGRHLADAYSIFADHLYDTGDTERAYLGYLELERRGGQEYIARAYTGIMRTAPDAETRLTYARRLRSLGGVTADALEEASIYEAEALLSSGSASERAQGRRSLEAIAANPHSAAGARSNVMLAESLLAEGKPQEALDMMEEFTSSGSPQQYWVARGFITLADAYTALGKDYLAREYLTSLRDNYPGDEADIREMIARRLSSTSKTTTK